MQEESLSACRDGGRRYALHSDVGDSAHIGDFDIPTPENASVDNATPIVRADVLGQHLRHCVPVAGREVR